MPSTFQQERQNVGEGWLSLVDELHEQIVAIVGEHDILQIKEKFGGLRYYYLLHGVTADQHAQVRDLVDEAERRSFEICETCGEPGGPDSTGGWVKTLCDEHRDERIARRKAVWQARSEEEG